MENKNVILLRHHPMNVHFTNPFYVSQVEGDIADYIVIDVTSRATRDKAFMKEHPSFAEDLSPFFIGPVVSSDGVKAYIFEIFWQCGKVYPCHDDNGKPNEAFFEWRNSFYGKQTCTKDLMRHACHDLGYENKDARYFAYFNKEKGKYEALGYVAARKKVYVPEYAKLIANTPSFLWLKSLVGQGKKIALVDFDGYNYGYPKAMELQHQAYLNKCKKQGTSPKQSLSDFLAIKNMKDVLSCPFLPAGHGFVIKALLQGDLEVSGDCVKDLSGVLS